MIGRMVYHLSYTLISLGSYFVWLDLLMFIAISVMLSSSVASLITPQPNLSPALPVFKLSASPPLPKSSSSACTINALPTTLLSPCKSTRLSINEYLQHHHHLQQYCLSLPHGHLSCRLPDHHVYAIWVITTSCTCTSIT